MGGASSKGGIVLKDAPSIKNDDLIMHNDSCGCFGQNKSGKQKTPQRSKSSRNSKEESHKEGQDEKIAKLREDERATSELIAGARLEEDVNVKFEPGATLQLSDLPDECLLGVLEQVEELFPCALVCKRWQELTREALPALRVLRFHDSRQLFTAEYKDIFRRFPNLTTLEFVGTLNDTILEAIASSCQHLVSLDVRCPSGGGAELMPDTLENLFQSCPDLEVFGIKVGIDDLTVPKGLEGLQRLRSLRLTCGRLELHAELAALPLLTELDIACLGTPNLPCSFFTGLENLQILKLQWGLTSLPNLNDLINLTCLSLVYCRRLALQPESLTHLQSLKELHLRHLHATKESLSLCSLINLQEVDIVDCPHMGIPALPSDSTAIVHVER